MEVMHDDDQMQGMAGMSPPDMNNTGYMMHMDDMVMHMTFFWGKNADILFTNWPGINSGGMYALALIFVFVLAFFVELISHSKFIKNGSNHVVAGLVQTLMHAIRVGLAYLVMLAVMSFNGGVFIVAVGGHSLGFLMFGSRVFRKATQEPEEKVSDLPPAVC